MYQHRLRERKTIGYEGFILKRHWRSTMTHVEKRTISLPPGQAGYIDAQVNSGLYASASEVVRAGLRALQERDAIVERWLQTQVAPIYDAMQADPSRAIPAETVLKNLRIHHAKRSKDPRGA
jgi:antitoxin ParD1/3/4